MDFSVPSACLDIELDGWNHDESKDRARDLYIRSQGWAVLRFCNERVETDINTVIDEIYTVLGGLL